MPSLRRRATCDAQAAIANTVELQGAFRAADGYFAADHTSFWGAKIG